MRFRKKVSILGFVVGSVVDIVGTNIWAIFMTVYVMLSYNLLQLASDPTEMTSRIMAIFKTDPLIFSANLIVGCLFSILGGYISAYIAKHDELLNGALAACLCVASGIYGIFSGTYTTSLFLAILSLGLSPLLALFGGFLRLKQRSRRIVEPAASESTAA